MGVYNHLPGDGREFVVTDPTACKIRAEDRRVVTSVDIGSFIKEVPSGANTAVFCSPDASGSTSQAANIAEALECGAQTLLVDEDTSATNFMVRDALIARVVEAEPIVPFVSRVRELFRTHGVSIILVVGGSGQYLHVADTVLGLQGYRCDDLTDQVTEILRESPGLCSLPPKPSTPLVLPRDRWVEVGRSFWCLNKDSPRVKATRGYIQCGTEEVDISHLEQLVEPAQANFIAQALLRLAEEKPSNSCLKSIGEKFETRPEVEPQTGKSWFPLGFSSRVRRFEMSGALNRLRSLVLRL